jgi:hypothetical protein
MKVANRIIGLAVLVLAPALAQAQLRLGENTKLSAGGLASFGYAGDYGDAIPSDHGLNFGFNGTVNGYYYNPSFVSFTANPYYDQSQANSDYQSITGAKGVDASANFFSGSHFPGSVNYHYDADSTGTFGLAGQPNFTTYGRGQGFGIGWAALLPGLPTLSVGYSQGDGHGTIYGTDQQTDSSQRTFNLRSTYKALGWLLNGSFDHQSLKSEFPEFLATGGDNVEDSSGHDFGFGAQHRLPMSGSLSINYTRSSFSSDYTSNLGQGEDTSNVSSYSDNVESAYANFHPTPKLAWNVAESYTSNLSGYLAQNLSNGGAPPVGVDLGSGARSFTMGGGAGYTFTPYLVGSASATYYDQFYSGQSYSGEYMSGTLNWNKRILDMFTFSVSVLDSSSDLGNNELGFAGYANYFRRFGRLTTSAQFSYAQNVQTFLITYTTSYYSYSGNVAYRLSQHTSWTAGFAGSHSGLSDSPGDSNHSESYFSSFTLPRFSASATFSQASGISLLGAGGLITPTPIPGLTNVILFNGSTYGGGVSVTPFKRLSIAGNFSRSISETLASVSSHNDVEVLNCQMQYHLRKIGLQAGYLRFTQGITAIGGLPANTTSFYGGITRWFDFF